MTGRPHWQILGLLLIALAGCTDTNRWREQVLTHDGTIIEVSRQATHRSRWSSRLSLGEGDGGSFGEAIEFRRGGELVRWVHPTERISTTNPATILDIVDGAPVIVVPIEAFKDCSRNGFPRAGLVAFRWSERGWHRVEDTTLPSVLKENLLLNRDMRSRRAKPKLGTLVALEDIASLEAGRKRRTLAEISDRPDPYNSACRYFMPARSEADEAFSRALTERIAAATPVDGRVVGSGARQRTSVSRRDVSRALGDGHAGGFVRDCADLVETLRPAMTTAMIDGRLEPRRAGTEIVLTRRTSPQTSIRIPSSSQGDSVFCSDGAIYAISRRDPSTFAFFKFIGGEREPGPVHEVTLPIPDSLPQSSWLTIWDPRVVSGQLRFTLARFEMHPINGDGEVWDSYDVVVDLVH